MQNLQAVYLASPVNEVRKADGPLFMRATQAQMLTMLAYGVLEPKMTEAGRIQHWKIKEGTKLSRLKLTLKAGNVSASAQGSKTWQRDGRGYSHNMKRCEAFR